MRQNNIPPSPWFVGDVISQPLQEPKQVEVCYDEPFNEIKRTYVVAHVFENHETLPVSRMMAYAPDMLRALRFLVEYLEAEYPDATEHDRALFPEIAQAYDVLKNLSDVQSDYVLSG